MYEKRIRTLLSDVPGIKKADYILIVNKNFEVIYNSRFDPRMGNKAAGSESDDFFAMYPSLNRNNSSIAHTMSTGEPVFNDAQEWSDITGKVYVTQNMTIPLMKNGHVEGVIELTKDLTTVGDVEHKDEYFKLQKKDSRFYPNRSGNKRIIFEDILTSNAGMLDAINKAKLFTKNSNPVLIYGETGTGKELFAQAMINYVATPRQKIIVQNCAAVPGTLIESILFGTTRGAYTGAENRKGLFEEADGGFFFLDELSALPYGVQGKLLRVLQDGTFRALGSGSEKHTSTKVIAAMNVDPVDAIKTKELRKDLFYRLSGSMIYIPPLRERPEDIDLLTEYYLEIYNGFYGKEVKRLSDDLYHFFHSYRWDGNVRELQHVIESMVLVADSEVLELSDLPVYIQSSGKGVSSETESAPEAPHQPGTPIRRTKQNDSMDLTAAVEALERKMILKALDASGGNRSHAAEALGIPRQTLIYKIKKLGIDR